MATLGTHSNMSGVPFFRCCCVSSALSKLCFLLFSAFNLAAESSVSDFQAVHATEERMGSAHPGSSASVDCKALPRSASAHLGPLPTRFFSDDEHRAFERDGFLIVSDMLDPQTLQELVMASHCFLDQTKKVDSYFSSIEMGMIFQAGDQVNQTITRAFRKVALESSFPSAAAELMGVGPTESVRVLRYAQVSELQRSLNLLAVSHNLYHLLLQRCFHVQRRQH